MRLFATALLASAAALSGCASASHVAPTAAADVRIEVTSEGEQGIGSGVYIGNGIIITAAHVVRNADSLMIKTEEGDYQLGEVLWLNDSYDVAAVAPRNPDIFVAANMACREPIVGEKIASMGNPAGIEFITMHGFVSGKTREMEPKWRAVFTTDMTTIGGMSGGATYDDAGNVIGITTGTLGFNGPSGGIGFVVPSSIVCKLMGRVV